MSNTEKPTKQVAFAIFHDGVQVQIDAPRDMTEFVDEGAVERAVKEMIDEASEIVLRVITGLHQQGLDHVQLALLVRLKPEEPETGRKAEF